MDEINANDSRIFWTGLYAPVAIWGSLLLVDVLKFNIQWLVVVVAALAMHIANIIGARRPPQPSRARITYPDTPLSLRGAAGYTKCSNDAKLRMQNLLDQGSAGLGVMKAFGQSSAFKGAMSGLFGAFGGPVRGSDANDRTSVTV
jgi:hypothetical protein